MAFTIGNAKTELSGILHGTNVNDVTSLNELFFRAGRTVLARINPRETRRIQNLTNALHDDVYNYTLPSDTKQIIDIRPQANRQSTEVFRQRFSEEFDSRKHIEDEIFQIQHDDFSKFIRISKDVSPSPVVLNELDTLTANGTWSAVGTASGLEADTQFYISGNGSVRFDSAASGDGIQNTTMTAVDLSKHDEVSTLFVRFYAADVSSITSVTLVWGNDLTTNYWTGVAQTAQHDGTAFRNGWNTVSFQWSAATETGTVAPATIDSAKVTFATSAAVSNISVDLITSSIGEIFEIEYYSQYLFRNSSGTFIEQPTSDSDLVNLETESLNIWLYETAILASQQIAGEDSVNDVRFFMSELHGEGNKQGLYDAYKQNYPNESQQVQGFYYRMI